MLNITHQMPEAINDGERVLQIRTGNNLDELYTVTVLDGDELEEELHRALRLMYGKRYRYEGFTDVTYVVEQAEAARRDVDECWKGEGWYDIRWSDGGCFGDPRFYYDEDDLLGDLVSAYDESTDTHLPYPEFIWDGERPHFTSMNWDTGLSSYLDMTDIEYARLPEDRKDAVEELAKVWGNPDLDERIDDLVERIYG